MNEFSQDGKSFLVGSEGLESPLQFRKVLNSRLVGLMRHSQAMPILTYISERARNASFIYRDGEEEDCLLV